MAVDRVVLSADVYLFCVAHALSTEGEEIMGLLIGDVSKVNGKSVSHISGVMMLCRSEKRLDRVEISPEQLSNAASHAENVQTQAMYQTMDDEFIGLIFSVFNEDKTTKVNRMQLTCFQSLNQRDEYDIDQFVSMEVPLCLLTTPQISSLCLESLIDLPSVLRAEEYETLNKSCLRRPVDSEGLEDVLTTLHNSAVYTKSLCNITEVISLPLLNVLHLRIDISTHVIKQLREERDKLMEALNLKKSTKQFS